MIFARPLASPVSATILLLALVAPAAQADPVTLVSRSATPPGSADGPSSDLVLDSTGRFGVFVSEASDLVAGQSGPVVQNVFLFDQQTGEVVMVSHAAGISTQSGNDSSGPVQFGPRISADGNWVAFESLATNLVTGQSDTNGVEDIFLWERATGTTRLVSHAASSVTVAGNDFSNTLSISDDGRFVTFVSAATDLPGVTSDTNGSDDVFLFDRFGSTKIVSHQAGIATITANSGGQSAEISGDGEWVVFESSSTDLVAGVTNTTGSVFLFERAAPLGSQLRLLSRSGGDPTTSGNDSSQVPQISVDGSVVVFETNATDLEGTVLDSNDERDLFIYDRLLDSLELLSHKNTSATVTPDRGSFEPSLSADGAFVAFKSKATNLVPGQVDSNAKDDVFLWTASTGSHTLVSSVEGLPTTAGNDFSVGHSISADGRFVAFFSLATDLITFLTDTNGTVDVFRWKRSTGDRILVSHTPGTPDQASDSNSSGIAISADGNIVGFLSGGTDLVADDDNLLTDAFLHGLPAEIFADGFESGNVSAWSSSTP